MYTKKKRNHKEKTVSHTGARQGHHTDGDAKSLRRININ